MSSRLVSLSVVPVALLVFLGGAACGTPEAVPCDPAIAACVEPTWESIHTIVVDGSCALAFCHGDADGNEGDLDLRDADASYALLMRVSETELCGPLALPLVAPGDPEGSLLYRKLFATTATTDDALCGFRMPYAGDPLPAQWTEAVRVWIEAGAPRR